MDLSNKIALVTGGASGIGRTISLELAKHGATVIINYHKSKAQAETLLEEIQALGGQAQAFQANIASYEEAKGLIDKIIDAYGQLHIVINNAGITDDQLILRMSEDQFDRVIDTNLKGVWNICKHSAKSLLKSGYGRLINIASVSGVLGNAGQSNYSSAKAGIIGMTKALAREFASRNVTVNAIAPGFITTDMTKNLPEEQVKKWAEQIPLRRFGKPEDVAHAVVFLASEEASYITGHTLMVDGGLVM